MKGKPVEQITAELGGSVACDMSLANTLAENAGTTFEGTKNYGDFDIAGELARIWLRQPNPHGRPNSDVVKPWRNGQDISRRPSNTWIIDFGAHMPESQASLNELPFAHVLRSVKPERVKVRRERTQRLWWIHEEARVSLREALAGLPRFIATARVTKHRFFVLLDANVLPDTRLNAIARSDDTNFGLLSSRIHEVWSLAQASMH